MASVGTVGGRFLSIRVVAEVIREWFCVGSCRAAKDPRRGPNPRRRRERPPERIRVFDGFPHNFRALSAC